MVETICSQDKMHISLTSINLCGIFLCSQHFTFLKAKTEELETNHKIKNIRNLYRGINVFETELVIEKVKNIRDLYKGINDFKGLPAYN